MSFINKKGEVVYKLKDIAINYITGEVFSLSFKLPFTIYRSWSVDRASLNFFPIQ